MTEEWKNRFDEERRKYEDMLRQKIRLEVKQEIEVEEGWEVTTNRKSRGPKDGKESKEPIVIDVKIPVRAHARIIGNQGENFKRLTQELDVIITMPKRDSGDDMVLIKGLPKDVHAAKRAIEDLASKGYSTVTHPGYTTKPFPLQNRFQLSTVFGKKGANVRAIANATDTTLKMPEKDSGSLTIMITGAERAIDAAITMINELLEQGYTKTTHPEWVCEEIPVPAAAIGAIIGQGGQRLQDLVAEHKVRIDVPRRDDPTAKQDAIYVKGPAKNITRIKREIASIVAEREVPFEQEVPDPAWQEEVQARQEVQAWQEVQAPRPWQALQALSCSCLLFRF